MPKEKRRGKGNRADKEKPLLTLQGVLRLEKSFITAQHDDAQVRERTTPVFKGTGQETTLAGSVSTAWLTLRYHLLTAGACRQKNGRLGSGGDQVSPRSF